MYNIRLVETYTSGHGDFDLRYQNVLSIGA